MGQYWRFVNPRRRQYYVPNGGNKWPDPLYTRQPFLTRSLTIPYPRPELARYLEKAPPPGAIARKGLLSLPDEVLLMILEDYDNFEDSPSDGVCSAITCKKLLALAEQMLTKRRNCRTATWANCPIACLGDYVDYDKASDALISPAMKDEIRAALALPRGENESSGKGYAGTDALNFMQVEEPYPCITLDGYMVYFLLKLPEADRRLYIAATGAILPTRDDWVLCNTAKEEFVRAGPLAALGGQPGDEQPFLKESQVDLGMALTARITWSNNHSGINWAREAASAFGTWAGDCFIVTTLEREPKIEGDFGWKDITTELVRDLKAIFCKDYGSNDWEAGLEERYTSSSFLGLTMYDSDWMVEILFPDDELLKMRLMGMECQRRVEAVLRSRKLKRTQNQDKRGIEGRS
ncbi:hypothetical protein GY45DRAFT_1328268 [Cubamyces sp. BRFM 1775]|nr:hypothetical protein GY45DRAFT_1328268 [Cubamyces sp. BRFM 1775]